MATEVIKTLRSSGGDYTSLSAWEAAQDGNLVSADEQRTLEMYDDWPAGEEGACTIDGSTTNSTCFLKVKAAAGEGHTGTYGSGAILVSPNNGFVFDIRDRYTQLEGLEIRGHQSYGSLSDRFSVRLYESSGDYAKIKNCLFTNKSGDSSGSRSCIHQRYSVADNVEIYNNIFDLSDGNSSNEVGIYCAHQYQAMGENSRVYNNTFVKLNSAFYIVASGASSSITCYNRNNLFYSCSQEFDGTIRNTWNQDYQATTKASGSSDLSTGANNVFSIDTTSSSSNTDIVDPSVENYRAEPGGDLDGAGENLTAYLTDDFEGNARPSTGAWTIGFSQILGSAPTLSNPEDLNPTTDGATIRCDVTF